MNFGQLLFSGFKAIANLSDAIDLSWEYSLLWVICFALTIYFALLLYQERMIEKELPGAVKKSATIATMSMLFLSLAVGIALLILSL